MTDEIQREQLSKTSPYKKAGYFAIFAAVAGISVPFLFGINTFTWIASWLFENWPRLLLVIGLVFWLGKSHMS